MSEPTPEEKSMGFLRDAKVHLTGTFVHPDGTESAIDIEHEAKAFSWTQTREPVLRQLDGANWKGPKKATHTLTWKTWEK